MQPNKYTSVEGGTLSESRPAVKTEKAYNFTLQNVGVNPVRIVIGTNASIELLPGQSYTFTGFPSAPLKTGSEISCKFDQGTTIIKYIIYYAK